MKLKTLSLSHIGSWVLVISFLWAVNCVAQTRPATANVDTPEELSIIDYSGFRLLNAKLAADGSRVLLNLDTPASQRGVVRIHETATGKMLYEREAMRPQTTLIIGCAISREGSRAILQELPARLPYQLKVIDVETGRTIWEGSSGPGDATFADAAGDILLVSHLTENLRPGMRELFEVNLLNGQQRWRFQVDAVPGILKTSSDGSLVLASQDKPGPDPQCVVDLSRQKVIATLDDSFLKSLSDKFVFFGERQEVVGLVENTLMRWDATTGKVINLIKQIEQLGLERHVTFSPNGRRLYMRYGINLNVLDSFTGTVVKHVVVPPQAQLEAVSDTGVAALRMIPISTMRIIKLNL